MVKSTIKYLGTNRFSSVDILASMIAGGYIWEDNLMAAGIIIIVGVVLSSTLEVVAKRIRV